MYLSLAYAWDDKVHTWNSVMAWPSSVPCLTQTPGQPTDKGNDALEKGSPRLLEGMKRVSVKPPIRDGGNTGASENTVLSQSGLAETKGKYLQLREFVRQAILTVLYVFKAKPLCW